MALEVPVVLAQIPCFIYSQLRVYRRAGDVTTQSYILGIGPPSPNWSLRDECTVHTRIALPCVEENGHAAHTKNLSDKLFCTVDDYHPIHPDILIIF